MRPHSSSDCGHGLSSIQSADNCTRLPSRLRRWFLANALISGLFALLCLRSGSKPSRLAYPCQQAALTAAASAFGAPVVAAILALRNGATGAFRSRRACLGSVCGLFVMSALVAWALSTPAVGDGPGPSGKPREDYRARVYHVTDCPEDPVGDRFVGLDNLITLMGAGGLKFYESSATSDMDSHQSNRRTTARGCRLAFADGSWPTH